MLISVHELHFDEREVEVLLVFLFFFEDFFLSEEVKRLKWQSTKTIVDSWEEEGVSEAARGGTKGFRQGRVCA